MVDGGLANPVVDVITNDPSPIVLPPLDDSAVDQDMGVSDGIILPNLPQEEIKQEIAAPSQPLSAQQ